MLMNFKRPKDEKPYYYSTTIENGEVVRHDNDEEHAVYESEMREISRRAGLWHRWVEQNYPHAYDEFGVMNQAIYNANAHVRQAFMEGRQSK